MIKKRSLPQGKKPDPERVQVLRSLPLEIKAQITGEEARAFLFNEELPASLLELLLWGEKPLRAGWPMPVFVDRIMTPQRLFDVQKR